MQIDDLALRIIGYLNRRAKMLKHLASLLIWFYNKNFIFYRTKKIKRIASKNRIRILFICSDIDTYVLDEIYDLLSRNKKYELTVGIPLYNHVDPSVGNIPEKQTVAKKFFAKKGIEAVIFEENNEKKRIKEINPDLILYCSTPALHSIIKIFNASRNAISISIPYGYYLSNLQQAQFDSDFANKMDYLFWESNISLQMSKHYARNRGINSYYLGYPKIDHLVYENIQNHPWKYSKKERKKVIWAPHHSIKQDSEHYGFSCFLELSDYILELAEKYYDDIQIAFKPHPLLKTKLYKHSEWGKERTNDYYKKWNNIENGQYTEHDYIALFIDSDAMILDSISFICEYAITGKPALFTVRDNTIAKKFNELGQEAFSHLYRTSNNLKSDINEFVVNVVIDGRDSMKNNRDDFVTQELLPPNGKTASENIVDFINNWILKDVR